MNISYRTVTYVYTKVRPTWKGISSQIVTK